MGKRYLCFGVFFMLFGNLIAEEGSAKIFGNVKSVKETAYTVTEKFGEVVKGEVLNTFVLNYDDKNHLTGEPYEGGKRLYKYNSNSNKIEQATYDSKGILKSRIAWDYNENGKINEENEYGSNGKLISKTKWKYDDFGNLVDKSKYDSGGELLEREVYVFEKSRCLEHSQYARYEKYEPKSQEGFFASTYQGIGRGSVKLVWRCVHIFDEKDREVQNHLLGPDQDSLEIRENKYDTRGNLIQTDYYYSEKKTSKKYNEKGVLIETEIASYHEEDSTYMHYDYWEDWKIGRYAMYTPCKTIYNNKGEIRSFGQANRDGSSTIKYYDENGNVIEMLQINDPSSWRKDWEQLNELVADDKIEYSYTYDKQGNWIKRMAYETKKNAPTVCAEIVEREIEYW